MLAGAGSGKTRVIVHKIARLLEAGYAPGADRGDHLHQQGRGRDARARARRWSAARAAAQLAVSTFHSLGVRILRSDGERLGLKPNFSILDSDDVLGVLQGRRRHAPTTRWRGAGSGRSARGRTAASTPPAPRPRCSRRHAATSDADALVAARVMQRYEERLAAYQAVDFDDLIGLPRKLLARDAEVRDAWQRARCATCWSTSTRTPTASSTSC